VGSVNASVLLLICLGDRRVLRVELSEALAALPKPWGSGDIFVREFNVLKTNFQHPALWGLVMHLCEIGLCLGLDRSYYLLVLDTWNWVVNLDFFGELLVIKRVSL
jgi:hypothetical protein